MFVILAEELHFGRAAARTGVTQSVLSVQIKRLEDVVGATLFKRSTREVHLTDVGAEFRRDALAILRRSDEAVLNARARSLGRDRLLRIALTPAAEISLIMDRLVHFRVDHPEAHWLIRELGTVEQEAALASGEIDVGILHPPLDRTDIETIQLSNDRFEIAFNPLFFSLPSRITWESFFSYPLIYYPRQRAPRLYNEMIASAERCGGSADIVAEAESFFAARSMAQVGLGIALLPPQVMLGQDLLRRIELPPGNCQTLQTSLAVHETMIDDPTVRQLINGLLMPDYPT